MSTASLVGLGAEILDLIGVLMIAYAALSVHHRFRHEHQVDDEVFEAMRNEQKLGIIGVIFIVCSFIAETAAILFA